MSMLRFLFVVVIVVGTLPTAQAHSPSHGHEHGMTMKRPDEHVLHSSSHATHPATTQTRPAPAAPASAPGPSMDNGTGIGAAPLTSGQYRGQPGGVASTAAVTVQANHLALLWVGQGDGTAGTPTLTDAHRTWEVVNTGFIGLRRLTLFRSMEPETTIGSVRIEPSSNVTAWSMVQYSHVSTSGAHGSGAVAQSAVTRNFEDLGSGYSIGGNTTLGDPVGAPGAVAAGFALHNQGLPLSAGNGYTLIGEKACATLCVQTEFRPDFTKMVDLNWTRKAHWLVVAVQLH